MGDGGGDVGMGMGDLFFRRKTVGESCLKSLKTFLYSRLSSEVVGTSSAIFRSHRKSLDAVGKSSEIQVLWRC